MQKSILTQFITKYNLGGLVESVKWRSTGTGLETNFATEAQDVIGFISTDLIKFTDGEEFNLSDTARLVRMLSVVGEEVDFKIEYANGQPYAFILKDNQIKAKLILSSPKATKNPSLKFTVKPTLSFKIDSDFIQKYNKGYSVLQESENVTVFSDGIAISVVLGHSSHGNSSTIDFIVNSPLTVASMPPVNFSARALREVLAANKDMTEGTITLDSRGVLHVQCVTPTFSRVEYYIVKKQDRS